MSQQADFHPLVSIVIPVYNGANYLSKSIGCALAQTYDNCEVIVVNDGSTDDGASARIAASFGGKIRYIEKKNGGVSSALNEGIRQMHGDYFSWLSHDDEYAPDKVADSVAALARAGCTGGGFIAYTGHYHINKDSEVLRTYADDFEKDRVYSSDEMVRYAATHQTLNGCCMLIPRTALQKAGGFDENLRYAQDALLWMQLFFGGVGLVFDGKVNDGYRLHTAQTSRLKHDLFEHDMLYISQVLAPQFCAAKNGTELAFQYALRNARYGAKQSVDALANALNQCNKPFTARQKRKLSAVLLASKGRETVKRVYYRFFLRVKV